MPNKERLSEILERMQSDHIPEHVAAAKKYIREGYPTSILFDEVNRTQQPNLISMFLYISGKRSSDEVLNAWRYLHNRFIASPKEFIIVAGRQFSDYRKINCNPFSLSNENRYLLFSARKYLLSKKTAPIFLYHLKEIRAIVQNSLQVEHIDNIVKSCNNRIRYTQIVENDILPDFEAEIGSGYCASTDEAWRQKALSLDTFARYIDLETLDQYPSLLYYEWLIRFFLTSCKEFFSTNLWITIFEKEHVIEDVQKTFHNVRKCYTNIDLSSHNDMVLPSSMLNQCCNSIANLFTYYVLDGSECISILKQVLHNCDDKKFCIDIFDKIENIALKSIEHNENTTISSIISFYLYFYFEQNRYPIKYDTTFSKNICSYATHAQALYYCEATLLPHISDTIFEGRESAKAARSYMAIDVLLPSGSLKAYTSVRNILVKKEIGHIDWEYWGIRLQEMYDDLYSRQYKQKQAFAIALLWEQLCQDICKQCFNDILTNHDGIRLVNNLIPDIIVGKTETNVAGAVTYAEMVIECKKSTYFLKSDNLRDNADTKYLDYCNSLEYWILEKPDYYVAPQNSKIKYRFAEDMLNLAWLDQHQKRKIETLINDNKQKEKYSPKIISQEKNIYVLLNAIDKLVENAKTSTLDQMTKTSYKVNFVIRQYDMNGIFIQEYASVIAAARAVGLTTDAITIVTSGKRNSAGGYLWKKCAIGTPIENIKPPNTALDLSGKIIFQVNRYGEVIATYSTISQAVKATNISRRSISDALKGVQKTAGGFVWQLGEQ